MIVLIISSIIAYAHCTNFSETYSAIENGTNNTKLHCEPVLGGNVGQEPNLEWELSLLKSMQWISSLGSIPCMLLIFVLVRAKLRNLFKNNRCEQFTDRSEV
jgi:hypothetical protein